MVERVILIALISAFAIQLMKKTGIVEWMQVHGNKIIAELFSCDFCMSWWANVIICLFVWIITGAYLVMLVPFFATMITRFLL